jgi:hypothetical protein
VLGSNSPIRAASEVELRVNHSTQLLFDAGAAQPTIRA